MTDRPDIDAIRKRLAAATPGPWGVMREELPADFPDDEQERAYPATIGPIVNWDHISTDADRVEADATLIAHAPTDIAALLAEVARLREELGTIAAVAGAEQDPREATRAVALLDVRARRAEAEVERLRIVLADAPAVIAVASETKARAEKAEAEAARLRAILVGARALAGEGSDVGVYLRGDPRGHDMLNTRPGAGEDGEDE